MGSKTTNFADVPDEIVFDIFRYLRESDLASMQLGFRCARRPDVRRISRVADDRALKVRLCLCRACERRRHGSEAPPFPLRDGAAAAASPGPPADLGGLVRAHRGAFLRTVNLDGYAGLTDEVLEALAASCFGAVVDLNVSNSAALTDRGLVAVSRHARALRRLACSQFLVSEGPGRRRTCAGLAAVAAGCRLLREVDVRGSRGWITVPGVRQFLAAAGRRFDTLRLARCRGVPMPSVESALAEAPETFARVGPAAAPEGGNDPGAGRALCVARRGDGRTIHVHF